MNRLSLTLVALAPLLGHVAHAAPVQVTVSARVLDSVGVPLNGTVPVTVELFDAAANGNQEFIETFPLATVSNGYIALVLGGDSLNTPLQHSVFDTDPLYVQFTVDGQAQLPRQRLGSVPSAISVAGGTVHAASATIDGGLTLGSVSDCSVQSDGTLFFNGTRILVCVGGEALSTDGRVGITLDSGARRWSDGTTAISCREYRNPSVPYEFRGSDATDGLYWVDPDGAGVGAPLQVYCDQSTGPGGWQLMLAYSHAANVTTAANPNVVPTSPIGSYSHRYLGDMGYPSANVVTEARFYCTTSLHSRVLHFTTSNSITRTDLWDGVGTANVGAWTSNFTLLTGHTGNLPGGTDTSYSGGFRAMLDFPFYNGGDWHWAIDASDDRWECDDHQSGPQGQTLHQIWWR